MTMVLVTLGYQEVTCDYFLNLSLQLILKSRYIVKHNVKPTQQWLHNSKNVNTEKRDVLKGCDRYAKRFTRVA